MGSVFSLTVPDATQCVEDHERDAPARLEQAEDHQRDGRELHRLQQCTNPPQISHPVLSKIRGNITL